MKHLSLAERLGMAEARGARLESRILKQEAIIEALRAQVARMDAAMRGLLRPTPAPNPVEIEDNPAIVCAALSAARMSDIAAQVALLRGITVMELRGTNRRVQYSHPRQEAMLIMHEAGYSMPRIGRFFRRDHTTVLHGIRAARARGEA